MAQPFSKVPSKSFPDECDLGYFWLVLLNMNVSLKQKQLNHPLKNSKTFEGLQTRSTANFIIEGY